MKYRATVTATIEIEADDREDADRILAWECPPLDEWTVQRINVEEVE